MPSHLQLPSISDHLRRGKRAITAKRNLKADTRSGAVYDFLMGTAALAWSREAQADQDKFRAIYFNTAVGDDLTDYVLKRFNIQRILDTQGTGTCVFTRPTAAGGAGTIYGGTQITVPDASGGAKIYQVTSDVAVSASALTSPVPITAVDFGLGTVVSNGSGVVLDPLWDATWTVVGVYCVNGTVYESAADLKARVVSTILANRPGYPTLIKTTLQSAGANQIVLFPSNYQLPDSGVSVAYVADSGYNTSKALIVSCASAVEAARVLGVDLMVLGMATTLLNIAITCSLWDDPSKFDQQAIMTQVSAAIVQYLSDATNAFAYKVDGIAGAAQRVSPAIQTPQVLSINGMSPPVDATLSNASWPAVLPRYYATIPSVQVTLTGPT